MVKSPLYWCSNSRKESDVIQQQREQRGDEGEQIWNKEPDKKKLGLAVGIRNLVRSSGSWNHRTNGRDRWRINSSQLRWRLWGSWKLRKTWDSLYEESRARRNNIEAEASTSFWDKNWLDWARARGSCFLNLRGRGSISTYRKYSPPGAASKSVLQTLHTPGLPSNIGQAWTSSSPMQG